MTFRILDHDMIDVHLADNGGWTVLHYSARYGSYESISFLVERGANIKSKQMMERTVFILPHTMDISNFVRH